ncbi:DUF1330 domain-containing protein [Paraburkholderia sp. Ac-20336]|uniref:DUF1330 domain-containing protein n=1 Tax=Burkholderiaceae TaxID=119060 RepID=UPI001420E9BB|nr:MULTISPECIES: DUF1330 domain-containing protein [Burkholderiaceae]MBN3801448.1 DUF1330 domain-containing protein [Paraburkholderia sp. Ac-20336]MBN3845999.1 DUF1330 domain-containing protein [Paraburkholderia sp. Ac-20342]NIF54140.1 DUF1330 domain-containing protein [Burkholderia sp. Ax-1724]NIF77749.1 DUF1330 domain-containing protein [Paraburkholderia sp. Cy-641]
MPKGYIIARVDVQNEEEYAKYAAFATPVIKAYGGRVLVRGGPCEVLEGSGRSRNVVIEFESFEQAKAYYKSAEYAQARALREGYAIADFIAVEGA